MGVSPSADGEWGVSPSADGEWGVSPSADGEEGYAPSTAPPFEKGGRKLLDVGNRKIFWNGVVRRYGKFLGMV